MNNIYINQDVISFIKQQANESDLEIYGLLIGYSNYLQQSFIITAISSKYYVQQSMVNAEPETTDILEIGNLMPHGIGIIGFYHSHPANTNVFHSHIDDKTLNNLSKLLNNCISIVTNGNDLKIYQMDINSNLKEIDFEIWNPKIPKFLQLKFSSESNILIEKFQMNKQNLNILIMNKVIDLIDNYWSNVQLYKGENVLHFKKRIYQYLTSNLENYALELRFEIEGEDDPFCINLIESLEENGSLNQHDSLDLYLCLTTSNIFYLSEEITTFNDFKEEMKIELIDVILGKKMSKCIIDFESMQVLLPEDYFIRFFGIYFKMHYFPREIEEQIMKYNCTINRNFNELLLENQEIIKRFYEITKFYMSLEITKKTKKFLKYFIEDLLYFLKIQELSDFYLKFSNLLEKLK